MYKKTIYLLLCMSIFIFNACTNIDESIQNDTDIILNISPSLIQNFNKSRLVIDNEGSSHFSSSDEVGLFAYRSGEEIYLSDKIFNKKFIFNGNNWNSESTLYWPDGAVGTACKLIAYYPYNSDISDIKNYEYKVNEDQSTVTKMISNDFLWSESLTHKEDKSIDMSMSHLFSMITINIKYETDNETVCNDIQVSAKTHAKINLSNGNVSATGNSSEIIPYNLKTPTGDYNKTVSVIIPPQNVDGTSFLTITINNIKYPINIEKPFESGKHYLLNYSVTNGNKIKAEGFYISDWDESITVSSGRLDNVNIYSTGDVITYIKNKSEKPVTIVVTGDGFTESDMLEGGIFETRAKEAIDFLFNTDPYKTYKQYFNVYFIAAVSNENGSDIFDEQIDKDTYFNSGWSNSTYSDMTTDYDKIFSFVEKYTPDIVNGESTINNVPVILLINDNRYGGICYSWSTGEAIALCPLPKGTLGWNSGTSENVGQSIGDWRNIAVHEYGGHGFGRLGDEYINYNAYYPNDDIYSHYWDIPFEKNITTDITDNSTSLYWRHLLNNTLYPRVGLYEGGAYYSKGVWRSEIVSCMLDNRQYYNMYSRQLIVERIKSIAGEVFDFNEFLNKDNNFDALRDGNGIMPLQEFSSKDITIYPPLAPPRLFNNK